MRKNYEVVFGPEGKEERAGFATRKEAEDFARKVVTEASQRIVEGMRKHAIFEKEVHDLEEVVHLVWSEEQEDVARGFRIWNAYEGLVAGVRAVRIVPHASRGGDPQP